MNIKSIAITGIILLFLTSPAAAMTKEEAASDFVQAGFHYREGNYQEAVNLYEKIVEAGWESGALYYNLGNSYFRRGETGRAVLNYERASLLVPRDEDLRHNRQFLYSTANLPSGADGNIFEKAMRGHIYFYTANEMVWVVYAVVLLIVIIHVAGLFFQWRPGLKAVILFILMVLMIAYLGGLIYKVQYYQDLAFIVEPSEAKFEPRDGATTHFRLKEGSRVKILNLQGPWVKIKRLDGRMGWVPQKSLERI